jgi:hypothetical protein
MQKISLKIVCVFCFILTYKIMGEKELACLRAISNIEGFLMWVKEIPDWIYQNIDDIFTYLTNK